MNFATDRF